MKLSVRPALTTAPVVRFWVDLHRGRNWPWLHNILLLSPLQEGGITKSKDEMWQFNLSALHRIQNLPNLMSSFSQQPKCQYAAAI